MQNGKNSCHRLNDLLSTISQSIIFLVKSIHNIYPHYIFTRKVDLILSNLLKCNTMKVEKAMSQTS
jgi:hypothetical protein